MRKWVENFYKIGREVHDDEPPIHISLHLQWLFLFIWSRHHDPSFGFSTSDLVVCRKQDRSPGAVKHSSREGLTIGCTVGVLRKFFQREKESTKVSTWFVEFFFIFGWGCNGFWSYCTWSISPPFSPFFRRTGWSDRCIDSSGTWASEVVAREKAEEINSSANGWVRGNWKACFQVWVVEFLNFNIDFVCVEDEEREVTPIRKKRKSEKENCPPARKKLSIPKAKASKDRKRGSTSSRRSRSSPELVSSSETEENESDDSEEEDDDDEISS